MTIDETWEETWQVWDNIIIQFTVTSFINDKTKTWCAFLVINFVEVVFKKSREGTSCFDQSDLNALNYVITVSQHEIPKRTWMYQKY